jgi:hypothetical protein
MNTGVHRTHCCIVHGCKYNNTECPVASGDLVQDYPCEWCSMAKTSYEEAKQIVAEGSSNWFTPKDRTQIAWNKDQHKFVPYDGDTYG